MLRALLRFESAKHDLVLKEHEMLHECVTRDVIACFLRVYDELGRGFTESVYDRSLAIELRELGMRFERQWPLTTRYRGHVVGAFRADFVVEDAVLVEIKAVRALEPRAEAQILGYLRATQLEVGLLLNFGQRAEFRRLIYTNDRKHRPRDHLDMARGD